MPNVELLTDNISPPPPEDSHARAALGFEDLICAACGATEGVHADRQLGGVYFCDECWERALPPEPDDELGTACFGG